MTHAEKMVEQEYPLPRNKWAAGTYLDNNLKARTAYVKGWEADKWISVEDGLPTENDADSLGFVIAWHEKTQLSVVVHWAVARVQPKYTHWQPLPSPPKTK